MCFSLFVCGSDKTALFVSLYPLVILALGTKPSHDKRSINVERKEDRRKDGRLAGWMDGCTSVLHRRGDCFHSGRGWGMVCTRIAHISWLLHVLSGWCTAAANHSGYLKSRRHFSNSASSGWYLGAQTRGIDVSWNQSKSLSENRKVLKPMKDWNFSPAFAWSLSISYF